MKNELCYLFPSAPQAEGASYRFTDKIGAVDKIRAWPYHITPPFTRSLEHRRQIPCAFRPHYNKTAISPPATMSSAAFSGLPALILLLSPKRTFALEKALCRGQHGETHDSLALTIRKSNTVASKWQKHAMI
jgi:hypothetical protein